MEKYQNSIASFVSIFDTFVNYIRKKEVLEASPSGSPKTIDCYAINELLAENEKQLYVKPKTPYTSFMLVRYLFEVSFAINLLNKGENAKGKPIIQLDAEVIEKYEMMDSEEKYLSFLQGFWCRLDYNFREYSTHSFIGSMGFMRYALKNSTKIKYDFQDGRLLWKEQNALYNNQWYDDGQFLELFANLGFWHLEKDATIIPKDKYDKTNLISLTFQELGLEICKIFTEKLPISLCNASLYKVFGVSYFSDASSQVKDKEKDLPNSLSVLYPHFDFKGRHPVLKEPFESFFKDLFSHAEVVLGTEKKVEEIHGNFYFKVSLDYPKSPYRVIAIHSSDTMEDLHLAIQDAFDFGNDHLYLFSMDMRGYHSSHVIDCPMAYDEGNEFADEVTIGSLPWIPKHKFLYIFDFGDNWEFVCKLQKIDTSEDPLQEYKIVETVGEAPKQYEDYDED
jgi:hypothetical protein